MGQHHHTHRWKKLSRSYRKRHYLCEIWLFLGKAVKADHVDHIIRIEEGGAIWSEENWMSVSEFWHNAKSRQEQLLGSLNLATIDTPHGKIPKNRQDIIDYMIDLRRKDLDDYLDGYRSLK